MSSATVGKQRVLDPVERLSEVLFGLIMVLGFTGSISAASSGTEQVRAVLLGALGCNFAWGIVDAVMYLLTILIERGRTLSIARAIRESQDPKRTRQLMAEALPGALAELFDSAALEGARKNLNALHPIPQQPRLDKEDWQGALGVFLLVFLSTLPLLVPFLLFSELYVAMRISNAVAIAMLYIVGHLLGRYAELGSFRTGLAMVAIGFLLVGLTIALGG